MQAGGGDSDEDEKNVYTALTTGNWARMQVGGGNSDIQDTEAMQRTLAPHVLSHDPPPQLSGYKG